MTGEGRKSQIKSTLQDAIHLSRDRAGRLTECTSLQSNNLARFPLHKLQIIGYRWEVIVTSVTKSI